MEKTTFVTVKTRLSFIDKIKNSLIGKKPECKGIVEQAEEIVEEYILNCRLQGVTLYKKRKKFNVKKAGLVAGAIIAAAATVYIIFI